MSHLAALPLVLVAGLVASSAHALDRIEVSADGRTVVHVDPEAPDASCAAAGGGVPYPLTPDWANALRRQVGGLQVADMNGDGWNDIVVGCYQSNSFPPYEHWFNHIYYNVAGTIEATPSWQSADEVSTGDIEVGDIDGDGFLDIFSANGGFSMSPSRIYRGGPGGPDTVADWSSAEPGLAWNNDAILFDVDHDGDLDIFTANQGNSTNDPYRPMYGFINPGGNALPSVVPSWQSAETSIQNFLAFGDLDGDGWEDLAVSKWANFESGIHLSVKGSLATVPSWTTGDTDTDKGVDWADVDGDGDVDLALGHDPTLLYRNDDGAPTLAWDATANYFGHSELRFCDVDMDGDEDLAEVHFANGFVNIYLNEGGTLSETPSWTFDSPHVGTAIAFGDLDGNGTPDLVVGNSGDDSVMVFYSTLAPCPDDLDGSGDVGFSDLLQLLAAWGPCAACPEDLDGSGAVDFADLLEVLAAWGDC